MANYDFILESINMHKQDVREAVRCGGNEEIGRQRMFLLGFLTGAKYGYDWDDPRHDELKAMADEMIACYPMPDKFSQDAWNCELRINREKGA